MPVAEYLSALPPDGDACNQHEKRKQKLTGGPHPAHLRTRHRNTTVFVVLGPDRNQVFIGRQPVHSIQSEITIAIEIDERVSRPRGAADDQESPLRVLFAGFVSSGSSNGRSTFLVLGVVYVDLGRTQVSGGHTRLRGIKQLLDRALVGALDV